MTYLPSINRNACEGKTSCVLVCPEQALEMFTLAPEDRRDLSLLGKLKGWAHGWNQARLIDPVMCSSCGLCVTACPEGAITLLPETEIGRG